MNPTYEDPFDNNASKKQLKTDRIFSIIYLIRSHVPSNQVFYFFFFFLKYNCSYLATNNLKRKEDSIFTIFKIIKTITVFGNGFCVFKSAYPYFCLVIFFFILLYILTVIILFKKYISKSIGQGVIVVFTYIFLVFCFISQFLCELLVPGIMVFSYSSKNWEGDSDCRDSFILNMSDSVLPKYILMIMNIISFFLINFFLYLFLLFINSPTRSFKHGNLNFNYKKVFTPAFVSFSLQGFITTSTLYSDSSRETIRLGFCIGVVCLFSLSTISRHREFNYYTLNFPLQYTIFATYMCLISGAVEIILYFIYNDPTLPSIYYYLKFSVIFLNSILLTYYFLANLNIYFTNQLISKIFIEKNKMTPGELAMYDLLLYNYLNDKCDFGELYHIYHTHKVKCTVQKCPCKILEIDKWIDRQAITEDNEHYLSVKLTKKKEEFKFSSIKDFIEIAEYEIRKNILLFKKDKKVSNFKQDLLILLHLDIIYLLKKDNCIAMYFCDRYRALSKKINLVTRYYLYEYKILISKDLASIDKISSIDRELNEKREMTRQMKEFYHYAEFMEKVKKMIINCVFALETILKYKRKQSMKNLSIGNLISCDQFLKISGQIQKTNQKLTRNLKEYLKSKEPDNPELCILVTYYFLMLNQKAPKKMVRKLEDILRKSGGNTKLTTTPYEDDDNNDYISQLAYDNVNISNPMIVILNSDDNFIIIHITMKMCSILKEGKKEILKNDLHNYLPKDIIKMHKIVMKQFLLNSSSQFIKDTFIMDKYLNLIPMKIICNPLNTLETNFGLVINFIETERNASLYNDYYFLLNSDFHFLGINELFAQEYFFNLQMMKIIHLDFCTFFGIKAEKLNLRLRNFFIKNKLTNKNELLEECNKEMSVFTISKMENLFSKNKMKFLGRKNQPLKVKEKIHKKDIINNLTQLQKNINDFGLDVEWYSRIGDFRDRLLVGIENSTNNDNDIGKAKSFLNFFEAYYTINSIGNFYYIIVNLRELLNNVGDGKMKAPIKQRNNTLISTKSSQKNFVLERENSLFGNGLSKREIDGIGTDQRSLGSSVSLLKKRSSKENQKTYFRHKLLNDSGNEASKTTKVDLSGSMQMILKDISEEKKKGKDVKKKKTEKNQKNQKNTKTPNGKEIHEEENITYENRKLFEKKRLYAWMSHVWKFLIFCQIFFCFLWLIFNGGDFQTAFELYFINLYSTNIQTDIFYSSLSMFARCGVYGPLTPEEDEKESVLMNKIANELRQHTKLFVNYVNNQIHKEEVKNIFSVLNEDIQLKEILPNKEEIVETSSFYEEVKFYQFKVYQLSNYGTFENCSVNKMKASDTTSQEMQEIYYIIHNIPSLLCNQFNQVNVVAHDIFENYLSKSKRKSTIYIITSIAAEIILMFFMQYIMSDHKANIQILLNIIYTPHKNDYLFEEDLYNYKELLFNFTKESYIHFRSMHKKILCNDNSSDSQRSLASANDTNLDNNNNNIFTETSTTEVIFRFSDNATIPKHYFITMFGMYVAGIVFIILEVVHLVKLSDGYKKLSKSNSISLNFIELLPKIIEMLLYERVSIITKNKDMITIPYEQYKNKTIYQYYSFNDLNEIQSQMEKFGTSAFTYLYYQANQIKKNIRQFINEESNCLSKTQFWHKQFNTPNMFCIYSSLGYQYSSLEYNNYVSIFKDLNEFSTDCRKHGDGFNNNTLDTIIEATVYKIEALYSDYVADELAIYDEESTKRYLTDKELYLIENNIKGQLKYVYSTYVNFTIQDIDNLVTNVKTIEIVFAVCLFVSAMSYALIVFFLLKFSNSNINVLVYIRSFMEQALSSKAR